MKVWLANNLDALIPILFELLNSMLTGIPSDVDNLFCEKMLEFLVFISEEAEIANYLNIICSLHVKLFRFLKEKFIMR
jgi:hypothetical protein